MLWLSGLTIVHEDIPEITDESADDINDSTGEPKKFSVKFTK